MRSNNTEGLSAGVRGVKVGSVKHCSGTGIASLCGMGVSASNNPNVVGSTRGTDPPGWL